MEIILDEGFLYGLGVFETIAVEQGSPLFLKGHLDRMKTALQKLDINNAQFQEKVTEKKILKYLDHNPMNHGVLKIMVSQENIIFSTRDNLYKEIDYVQGMRVDFSKVLRNETSLFAYIKSNQYGDNIIEKRKAVHNGIEEPIFLNTKGQLTEGATSNLFLIKNGILYTPNLECGILDGVMRRYILDSYPVEERVLDPSEIPSCEEMFLTNSLMGIMPVHSFGNHIFQSMEIGFQMHLEYEQFIANNLRNQ